MKARLLFTIAMVLTKPIYMLANLRPVSNRALMSTICLLTIASGFIYAQNFITEWTFPTDANQIRFKAQSSGVINYTWESMPSGNSGSGSFTPDTFDFVTLSDLSIMANDVVIVEMEPENLQRFYIEGGINKDRLTDIKQWGAVNWTSMSAAFDGCTNLNISASDVPNLSNVSSMFRMFRSATQFNSNIGSWDVSNITNMSDTFNNALFFDQNIGSWNVENVTNMSGMFSNSSAFNQDIADWNVANVTNMEGMFRNTSNFNQDIGGWTVSNVTNMREMFRNTAVFNQDLNTWDVSNVTTMMDMFNAANAFNGDISSWDLSNVTTALYMFRNTNAFNQPIGDWDVTGIVNMTGMFWDAIAFNQDIGNWDVSGVTNMTQMFSGASAFNQDIGNWDISSLTNISQMFRNASLFNQDISAWNVSGITNMFRFLNGASSFNQNLGSWILSSTVNLGNMLDSSGMDCDNYSATLVGWQANNPTVSNRSLGAFGRTYGTAANMARTTLVNDRGWSINGDSASDSACNTVLSVDEFTSNEIKFIHLFPNPTNSEITIQFDKSYSDISLRIFTVNGQQLLNRKYAHTDKIRLDIEAKTGLYLAEITIGSIRRTYKIVKN
ncbi:BspA family leucine-rich repeat surface protein [Paucihalobacter sp.]|uniref:BspA family leucine-rich repeat surface protein n=1 Tax=Paucihalobacter sp. TaxID=2850405 RepID=UPI002FE2BB30